MKMNKDEATLAYREAAVRTASQVGLVVMMYDMIIEDLRQAIDCVSTGDIVGRTNSIKHAMAVLGQLQGTLDMERGGEAARNLDTFYAIARAKLLEAHIKCSKKLLESQAKLFAEVRAAWQAVEEQSKSARFGNHHHEDAGITDTRLPQLTPSAADTQAESLDNTKQWTA